MIDWTQIKQFKQNHPSIYALLDTIWEASHEGESAYDDYKIYTYSDLETFLTSNHPTAIILRATAEKLETILKDYN